MINQQLQLVYEIEGLLLLVRESVGDIDKADRLNSLIDSKLNKLAELRYNSAASECSGIAVNTDSVEDVNNCDCPSDNDAISSDDAEIADSAEYEEASDADVNCQSEISGPDSEHKICSNDKAGYNADENHSASIEENIDPKDDVVVSEDEIRVEIPASAYETETTEEDRSNRCECGRKETNAVNRRHFPFTLNDRFRFRRELFGNSDNEYRSALSLLQQFADYNEAYNYFISDLGWDKDSPEVVDFLEIVKNGYER